MIIYNCTLSILIICGTIHCQQVGRGSDEKKLIRSQNTLLNRPHKPEHENNYKGVFLHSIYYTLFLQRERRNNYFLIEHIIPYLLCCSHYRPMVHLVHHMYLCKPTNTVHLLFGTSHSQVDPTIVLFCTICFGKSTLKEPF